MKEKRWKFGHAKYPMWFVLLVGRDEVAIGFFGRIWGFKYE